MPDTLLDEESGEMFSHGAAVFEEAETSASSEAPVRMLAVLPGIGRQLHVERRQALGREMWAVAEEECWPGMVMELRRLSADMTVMTWDGEVVLFGPDLVLRPLPTEAREDTVSDRMEGLALYLVEQDVVSHEVLALDRAVVRASSKEEACALVADWLKDEADRLDRELGDLDGLFAMELGAADPNDEEHGVVLARSRD
ncbi:MAG TPA: hypothetical protein VKT82_05115 [Ktedonobacterales bacterium]|nr:hypothetical protein [Ktedonobacterales bacterium]